AIYLSAPAHPAQPHGWRRRQGVDAADLGLFLAVLDLGNIHWGSAELGPLGFGGLRKHSGSWPIRSPVPARLHADRVGDWNGRVFYRTDPVPEIGRCDVGFAQRFRSRARMAHHVFLSGDDVTRLFAGNDVA